MSKKMRERPVVVTTVHRGVFFGYATDTRGKTISPHCLRPGLPFHERWDDGVDTGGVIGGAQSEVS